LHGVVDRAGWMGCHTGRTSGLSTGAKVPNSRRGVNEAPAFCARALSPAPNPTYPVRWPSTVSAGGEQDGGGERATEGDDASGGLQMTQGFFVMTSMTPAVLPIPNLVVASHARYIRMLETCDAGMFRSDAMGPYSIPSR
jgi:hypothetical protein